MKEKWDRIDSIIYFGDGGIDIRHASNSIERARLISSAPDLLEALEDMLNQGCGHYSKKSCGHDFYCVCPGDKARAAIKKARGQ